MRIRNKIKAKYFVSISIVLLILGVWGYALFFYTNPPCAQVRIVYKNFDLRLYDENFIRTLLEKHESTKTENLKIKQIHPSAIRDSLKKLPWIQDVQVFFTMQKLLEINIYYRIPIAKLYLAQMGDYVYLDTHGKILPRMPRLIAHVPVVVCAGREVVAWTEPQRLRLVYLLRLIRGSDTWNKTFDFMEITKPTFVSVHLRGTRHKEIIIGNLDNLRNKIRKFDVFYRNYVARTTKPKTYCVLDLRFKNQLVAR